MKTPPNVGNCENSLADTVRIVTGVAESANKRLRSDPYLSRQAVYCDFCDGVLTLRGRLSSYYLKQLAHKCVAGIDGVRRISNWIEVGAYKPRSR